MDKNSSKTRLYPRGIGFSSDEVLGNSNYIKNMEKYKETSILGIYILTISTRNIIALSKYIENIPCNSLILLHINLVIDGAKEYLNEIQENLIIFKEYSVKFLYEYPALYKYIRDLGSSIKSYIELKNIQTIPKHKCEYLYYLIKRNISFNNNFVVFACTIV